MLHVWSPWGCCWLRPPAPNAALFWGATINGETYGEPEPAPANQTAWNQFEQHAGKKVAVLNTSQGWLNFDSQKMDTVRARGAIPMVTMGLGEGVTLAQSRRRGPGLR